MLEIKLWVMPNHGFRSLSTLKEELRDFHKENPGLSVKSEVHTRATLWKKLMQSFKKPKEVQRPDLIQISGTWNSTLAYLGLLEELSELLPQAENQDWHPLILPNLLLSGTRRLFSLPWFMELKVLYYRRDVLEKMRVPEEHLDDWEGFTETCRVVQRFHRQNGIYPLSFPNQKEGVSAQDVAPCLWGFGGDFFSRDSRRTLIHREESLLGIGSYMNLIAEGLMPLFGKGGLPYGDFFQGHFAMELGNRLPHRYHPEVARSLGVRLHPKGKAKRATVANIHALALTRGGAHIKEAALLLQYLTRPRTQEHYAREIGALPPRTSSFQRFFEKTPKIGEVLQESLKIAQTFPNLLTSGTLEKILDQSLESILESILRKNYTPELLHQELMHAGAEMDYVLSLYR